MFDCIKFEKLWRLINRYKNACIADSWSGSKDPDDLPAIQKELKDSKAGLNKFIKTLLEKKE